MPHYPISIQGIHTETFNEYIKSQSFGFWGTHTIDAMKKDAVKKRRKHKRSKEQNPELLPHKTIPNQPYSPSGSWSSPWRSWWSAWAKARAYLCSGSWEGSSYTRLPHLASPPFAALLTTVLKHCSPLHTTAHHCAEALHCIFLHSFNSRC